MADENNAAAPAVGEGTAAPALDPKTPAVATELDPNDIGGDTGAADPPDWRERVATMAGIKDNPREMAWLNRFASEENYHKAVPKLRRDMSAGKTSQFALPEDATPEEVAAHRKALGIPEKPDGYGLVFPTEVNATEADTAGLNAWAAYAHENHLPPAAAKLGAEFYGRMMIQAREARAEFLREAEADAKAELLQEWGRREYPRNITLAYEFGETMIGEEKAAALASLQLADGRPLGKHPDYVRLLASGARVTVNPERLVAGDGMGGGKSIDDEIKELRTLSVTGKITKDQDARLNELYRARLERENREGRAHAGSQAA